MMSTGSWDPGKASGSLQHQPPVGWLGEEGTSNCVEQRGWGTEMDILVCWRVRRRRIRIGDSGDVVHHGYAPVDITVVGDLGQSQAIPESPEQGNVDAPVNTQ